MTDGWQQADSSWPLTPAGILPTIFGSQRAFLSNLIPACPHFSQGTLLPNLVAIGHSWIIWPLVDPCMTFDPRNAVQSGGPSTKFGGHWAFLKQLDLWMISDLWWGRFENMLSKPRTKFQHHTSNHDETHSRTYTTPHPYPHTNIHTDSIILVV